MIDFTQPLIGTAKVGNNKALLFLYRPRMVHNHFKRPLAYSFNNEFIENTVTQLHQNSINAVNRSVNTVAAASCVKPSINGTPLRTSEYSYNWTFAIIIDTPMTVNRMPMRAIYYGVCQDEPISNQASATPDKFLNAACGMIVTRKTVMTKRDGIYGSTAPSFAVVSDTEVSPYDDTVWNGDRTYNNFFMLDTSSVASTLSDSDISDGETTMVVDDSRSLNAERTFVFPSKLTIPKTHTTEILRCMSNKLDDITYGSVSGEVRSELSALSSSELFTNDVLDDMINQRNYDLSSSKAIYTSMGNGLPDFFYLSVVMSTYAPEVILLDATPVRGDVIPQDLSTINNVYSSMLSSSVPAYISNVGLSSVGFSYKSATDEATLYHIDSITDDSQVVLKHKWNNLLRLLKSEIFNILLVNGGHFELTMMVNVSDVTAIRLNFNDFTKLAVDSVYQENTILGGIVSSVIGDKSALLNNTSELNTLIGNVDMMIPEGGAI